MSVSAQTTPRATLAPLGPSDAPLLVATGIHKSYGMGRARLRVLSDCELRVRAGEFVAIMGKSGSGKSTLLHILGALDVPDRGQVVFDGGPIFAPEGQRRLRTSVTDVFSAAERRRIQVRRREFGFVFQFYHLLPELDVLENVMLPNMVACSTWRWLSGARRESQERARAMLERVGLSERLRHRPNELSGGERQRVAIARALSHGPRILLADEPTGNLDAEAGAQILSILKGLHAEGQTIIMVTHDPSIAAQADRTLRLERGRLSAPATTS